MAARQLLTFHIVTSGATNPDAIGYLLSDDVLALDAHATAPSDAEYGLPFTTTNYTQTSITSQGGNYFVYRKDDSTLWVRPTRLLAHSLTITATPMGGGGGGGSGGSSDGAELFSGNIDATANLMAATGYTLPTAAEQPWLLMRLDSTLTTSPNIGQWAWIRLAELLAKEDSAVGESPSQTTSFRIYPVGPATNQSLDLAHSAAGELLVSVMNEMLDPMPLYIRSAPVGGGGTTSAQTAGGTSEQVIVGSRLATTEYGLGTLWTAVVDAISPTISPAINPDNLLSIAVGLRIDTEAAPEVIISGASIRRMVHTNDPLPSDRRILRRDTRRVLLGAGPTEQRGQGYRS